MLNHQPPIIRQTLFYVDKNRKYLFDVNQNITIHTLKKMINAAANLGKINIRIFQDGIEYTNKDTSTLEELFPNIQKVDFNIQISYDNIEELDSLIKLKLKNYCDLHYGKYPYFYCYTCEKSICSNCLNEGKHKEHDIKEKYDYLQNSKNLIEMVFYDLKNILDKAKNINENSVKELRNEVNIKFSKLIELIKIIENKMITIINSFLEKEKGNLKTIQNNVFLLKNHCAEGLDKLKSEIEIEDMMIDENIFLTFDRKFGEIASEKKQFEDDVKKFKEYSETLYLIQNIIGKSYEEIHKFLMNFLNGPTLNEIQDKIKSQNIDVVDKKKIFDKLLSDIKRDDNNIHNSVKPTQQFNLNDDNNNNNENIDNNNNNNNNFQISENHLLNNLENQNEYDNNNNIPKTYHQPKFSIINENNQNESNNFTNNFENNNSSVKNNNNIPFQTYIDNTYLNSEEPKNLKTQSKSETTSNNYNTISKDNSNMKNIVSVSNTGNKSYLEEEEIGVNEKKMLEKQALFQYQTDKSLMKIGQVIPHSKYIIIYNSYKNIIRRRTIEFPIFSDRFTEFLNESAWVNFKNKLYIMGGDNEDGTSSNIFFIYDTINSNIIRGPNSLKSHLSHTLLANENYIYSIGGKDNCCEVFDINLNKWNYLPSLNHIQQYPILYIYKHYLYSFFGLDEFNEPTDIVQRLNLNNSLGKWEDFQYIRNGINCKFYGAGIIKINEDEIYFMGGKDKIGIRDNVIKFNFVNKNILQTPFALEEKVYFKESFLLKMKNNVYGNFSMERHNPFLQISFDVK